MNYDDTTTAYPIHDASSGPYIDEANGTSANPPTGASVTITGGQLPSSTAVPTALIPPTSVSPAPPPAGLLYFKDYAYWNGRAGTGTSATVSSPFYRYPIFLQWNNLYLETGPQGFNGSSTLNVFATPYDMSKEDGTPSAFVGIQFVALFAGEDPSYWSNLWVYTDPVTHVTTNETYTGFIQWVIQDTNPLYISLECQDPTTLNWHPYNFISSLSSILGDNSSSTGLNYVGTPGTIGSYAANGQTNPSGRGGIMARPDPRTDRFSLVVGRIAQDFQGGTDKTMFPEQVPAQQLVYSMEDHWPWRTYGFVYTPDQGIGSIPGFGGSGGATVVDWQVNQTNYVSSGGRNAFYVDPDGVVRPGDAYRVNTLSGDGCETYHGGSEMSISSSNPPTSPSTTGNPTTPVSLLPVNTVSSPPGTAVPTGSAQSRRPVILNRPFRNVGELGYAFRDLPFKTLDFFSKYSGDAALLDLFSITDEPPVSAGQVNLSNAPTSTLTAIMSAATKMEINAQYASAYDSKYASGVNASSGTPNFMTASDATNVASQLTSSFSTNGPLGNRADLVARLDPVIGTPSSYTSAYSPGGALYTGTTSLIGQGYLDYANKAYAEAPVRALSNVASTRTWNLLIDIIAQSGQMSPTAATLNDFVVQSEKRYWLHIAIDRYTGKIIDQQLEPVYE